MGLVMQTISLSEEKRRYHRLQPTVEPEPQATFEIDERKIEVKVVNLSPGGLLCYVKNNGSCCKAETVIPKIVIKIPEKKPVVYAGKIVRVQPTAKSEKNFCAVEFIEFEEKILNKGSKPLKNNLIDLMDDAYLKRLQSYKSFLIAKSLDEELALRKIIYDGFREESKKLPLEERWFFYEIIDEMKRREPNFPGEMKIEFLRLCRGEDRSEFVYPKKKTGGIRSFFKKILPV